MLISILVFFILLLIQFLLGIYSWIIVKNLSHKYSFILGSQKEPAETLEVYKESNKKLKLKATHNLDQPAYSDSNFLLIDSKKMYAKDLYTNFLVIYQLELTKDENSFIRNLGMYQNILFIFEIVFFVVSISILTELSPFITIIPVVLQAISIFLSVFAYTIQEIMLADVLATSEKILELDNVESARAEALKEDLKTSVFQYPFEIAWKIFQFLKP